MKNTYSYFEHEHTGHPIRVMNGHTVMYPIRVHRNKKTGKYYLLILEVYAKRWKRCDEFEFDDFISCHLYACQLRRELLYDYIKSPKLKKEAKIKLSVSAPLR